MSIETRAYDKPNNDGFLPDPVVVLVVTGTHDVSRLVAMLAGMPPTIEYVAVGERVRQQVRRHSAGRDALALLKAHGGPDFTDDTTDTEAITDVVLGELGGRKGFDWRWDDLDEDIQQEIRDALTERISDALSDPTSRAPEVTS